MGENSRRSFLASLSLITIGLVFCYPTLASSAVSPGAPDVEKRYDAGPTKTGNYVSDGFFSGGSRTITAAKLKDIRRAKSGTGFERIVLDLDSLSEEKSSVPYFEVKSVPKEGRIVLSIWSDVVYDFNSAQVHKSFAKSANVKRLNVLPRVEDGLTIIEFVMNPRKKGAKPAKLEVFRLANPSRIILDVI